MPSVKRSQDKVAPQLDAVTRLPKGGNALTIVMKTTKATQVSPLSSFRPQQLTLNIEKSRDQSQLLSPFMRSDKKASVMKQSSVLDDCEHTVQLNAHEEKFECVGVSLRQTTTPDDLRRKAANTRTLSTREVSHFLGLNKRKTVQKNLTCMGTGTESATTKPFYAQVRSKKGVYNYRGRHMPARQNDRSEKSISKVSQEQEGQPFLLPVMQCNDSQLKVTIQKSKLKTKDLSDVVHD